MTSNVAFDVAVFLVLCAVMYFHMLSAGCPHSQVEQPLCLECMRVLSDKLDKEVEDVNRDIEAYEACLKRLEGETRVVLTEADFLKEKLKVLNWF